MTGTRHVITFITVYNLIIAKDMGARKDKCTIVHMSCAHTMYAKGKIKNDGTLYTSNLLMVNF